jgi:DNA-binding transcriptional LysR family regulator
MNSRILRHRLAKVDLKLLVCLDALLEVRQVSAAARRLGVDQPAVSAALKRLRDLFDDELFTRAGGAMAPTPLALALAPPLADLLHGAERLLEHAAPEAGERHEGRFNLLFGADFLETRFAPAVAAEVSHLMPGLTLRFALPGVRATLAQYASGDIDLGLGYLPNPPPTLKHARLYTEPWQVLARRGTARLDAAAYASAIHIDISPAGAGSYTRIIDGALGRHGVRRRVGATTTGFESAAAIVAGSTLVATVPESVARRAARAHGVDALPAPLEIPPVEIYLYWLESADRDPLNRRLREALRRAAQTAL